MRMKYALCFVPVVAIAAWLMLRGHHGVARSHGATAVSVAAQESPPPAPGSTAPTSERAIRRDRDEPAPPATGERPAVTTQSPAAPVQSLSPPSPAAARPEPPPPIPALPTLPDDKDSGAGGGLNDKTGWSDHSVVRQLNKEFMPLANECILHAKERKPFLEGMLSFTVIISPTVDGKAIVSSLKARPDNKIHDPELWECIRESSFALEGLTAPHDFDISMPVTRDDAG